MEASSEPTDTAAGPGLVVDADVHNAVPSVKALLPYLSSYWQEEITNTAFQGASEEVYRPTLPTSSRPDASVPESGRLGADVKLLIHDVLDRTGADFAILNCAYAVDTIPNPDGSAAIAAAVNDWQIAEWLEEDSRLRASLVVPSQDPELAAAEIARVGEIPGFVQVSLAARTALYGHRRYRRVFEAALEHGLAVSIQFGGLSGNAPSSVGWPSFHMEEYVDMSAVMQSQLMSLIAEGVFDQFPDLRVLFADSGFTWLPSFMWRFDKDWKGLRREIPWVRRAPSEYIREHVKFTATHIDAPTDQPRVLVDILAQIWAGETLFYGSDYPHWPFGEHQRALIDALTPVQRTKLMGVNAANFYGLKRQDR